MPSESDEESISTEYKWEEGATSKGAELSCEIDYTILFWSRILSRNSLHFVEISTLRGYYLHFVDIYVLRGYYPHFVEISMFRRYYPHFVEISMSRGYYPHFVDICIT